MTTNETLPTDLAPLKTEAKRAFPYRSVGYALYWWGLTIGAALLFGGALIVLAIIAFFLEAVKLSPPKSVFDALISPAAYLYGRILPSETKAISLSETSFDIEGEGSIYFHRPIEYKVRIYKTDCYLLMRQEETILILKVKNWSLTPRERIEFEVKGATRTQREGIYFTVDGERESQFVRALMERLLGA